MTEMQSAGRRIRPPEQLSYAFGLIALLADGRREH